MKLILLSGGSGKRLWPLSNDVRSKQFLKLIRSAHNEPEAMVQRVWRQLDSCKWSEPVYISAGRSHVDLIQSQLGEDVPLIVEPEKRDTFPAISLAVTYLYSALQMNPDEVVAIMPVDPFVEDRFMERIKELEKVLLSSGANLALIGVKPTYPSTKYGYIVPRLDSEADKAERRFAYNEVKSFKEKPSLEQAQDLVEKKALWNCGIFAFRLGYLIRELEKKGLPTEYNRMLENYSQLPAISFDYEIVEKAEKVVVLPYDGYWKDLGTWNTLTEEMSGNEIGKVLLDESCTNTHVINELDIPIVSIGLSDMIVAASPDGILVSTKEHSHMVKNLALDWTKRPMYEERRWGWYQVMHFQKNEEDVEVLTKRLHINAGKNLSYQYHHHRSEIWMIVEGSGDFILDDQLRLVGPGDVLQIPVGAKHAIKATSELEFIEVQMGSQLVEEDIVRLGMTWAEILEQISNQGDQHD
ncbi:sugar phosphate nucleotidyltransferase [Brevibacillus sp. 179-C 1.1 NHS]|uniref:sugar phosphate nucleotidyltransferase n=1 Tax=Brevibacillus sp. 179-C 1.1 NHS TaxID=3235177 RepID=UPI0039A2E397